MKTSLSMKWFNVLLCASLIAGLAISVQPVATARAALPGWILDSEWQIGSATASSGQNNGGPDPASDNTSTADNMVAGVVIGGNASISNHGYYYLTSPAMDTTSAAGTLTFAYYRWLNSDYTPYMQNAIDVWDGGVANLVG